MKNKVVIILAILFFAAINTTYFWEGKLGVWAIPEFALVAFTFISLLVFLFNSLLLAFKEKFKNKRRLFSIAVIVVVLCNAVFFPNGLINFERWNGDDVLIAGAAGSANCTTTFKLKDNHRFSERNICFGVEDIKGNYSLVNDTIYFTNVVTGRGNPAYYKFAVIKPSTFYNDNKHFDLVRYYSVTDTTGSALWIAENNLHHLPAK